MRRVRFVATCVCCVFLLLLSGSRAGNSKAADDLKTGLVGYWNLAGDCKDHSGRGNHGRNHGVDLAADRACGTFDGTGSYIEVPNSDSLSLGTGAFSIAAWVKCDDSGADVIGDILSKYDASKRNGITLSINASSPGYNSQGNNRLLCFGIDNAKLSDWKDCGKPSEKSNYVNSLVVFNGKLYAATTDAKEKEDWGHVCRYDGDRNWVDCGRVGDLHSHGVGPIVVHNGQLYAATWNYEFTGRRRREHHTWDYSHVYRYRGGKQWEDCGQPGKNRRLFALASFKGRLYALGDGAVIEKVYECYRYEGGKQWTISKVPNTCSTLAIHDGKLYVGGAKSRRHYHEVCAYDGRKEFSKSSSWENLSYLPAGLNQVHTLEVYRGELCAGTFPLGSVAALRNGNWRSLGDANLYDDYKKWMEVNAITVYNGKFYAGTLPLGGVWRCDDGEKWTLLKRMLDPERHKIPPVNMDKLVRLTSLTVYQGKLFASVGSASSIWTASSDAKGSVFCIEAGKCISYDHDLGSGWKHVAAVKDGGTLKLYVNGQVVANSAPFEPAEYDLSNDRPLKIGFGEMDYFSGQMREIRLYNRAVTDEEIKALASTKN